jgi:cytochrome P450
MAKQDLDHKDIMSVILQNEDSKKSLAPTEIILNMVLFLSAGSETTSISLTAWTYLICAHPQAYQRLVHEIRTSFERSSDMTLDAVMNLSYLGATISEALRLFPPGAVNQQRVVPEGGAQIDKYFIQGGTTVSVSPWSATRSPMNFHKPNEFEPRRWLSDCPPEFQNDKLHASQPFNVGPKACIGKDLNDFETRLILSHLIWNFDFELESTPQLAEKNKLWNTDPMTTSINVFQVLLKPDLWVRFKEVTH